ncbi:MAG: hypothetical protein FRX48_08381 [Lasallia pustulata]|uniref:Uncharacterized protein n=1 Tax=Lasallia pustulata TaxID=136370 RepID=A0A5M8PGL1_9LECA|nr:MAG: hypothetical protein FRX48_08381 [Lasallia pustulata]
MAGKASLYGAPRPKTSSKSKEISSSSSLAFSSQLSSLLAQTSTSPSTTGRSRPSKSKTDIFTARNKNTRKRAAADISEDGIAPGHQQDIGGVDSTILHRSKRKMEEKARLYAAMKRGDYVPPSGTDNRRDEGGLVDFDRKWAEDEAAGRKPNYETSSDSGGDGEEEELVDYEDEFGRQRRGTQAEAAREERRKQGIAQAADEVGRFSARPAPPSQIIYGDTVQTAAFNPDEPVAAQMEEIARKRDRSMTPPDEVHYDANGEVRTKGVGFYSFSKDKEGRKREMEALEKERLQTERGRKEKQERKDKRKEEIEARRRLIREKQAERFLEGLD